MIVTAILDIKIVWMKTEHVVPWQTKLFSASKLHEIQRTHNYVTFFRFKLILLIAIL